MAFSFSCLRFILTRRRRRGWRIIYALVILYLSTLMCSMHMVATEYSKNVSPQENPKTLALLYPPGMIGGFRNQVYRFVSLVRHAKRYDQSQLLLPSIVFSTTYKGSNQFYPMPMTEIFDVDYWNSFHPELPKLVDSVSGMSDCWSVKNNDTEIEESYLQTLLSKYGQNVIRIRPVNDTVFTSPMLDKLLKESILLSPVNQFTRAILLGRVEILKPRKIDLSPDVEDCQNPFVHGGGRLGGKLWNEYVHMPKEDPSLPQNSVAAIENSQLIEKVSHALLPNEKWQSVANECILGHQQSSVQTTLAPYLALHTRVETDMLEHACGKNMEKNLSAILNMVESFKQDYNYKQQQKLEGTVLAVSRYGMQRKPRNPSVQTIINSNWKTLQTKSQSGDIIECGEVWMEKWYSKHSDIVPSDYYGSLVPMVLNFFIATRATVFIGVAKSSWSTDVWMTRYHQGLGHLNFQYTPQGIIPVANGGLPPAHNGCND